MGFSTSVGRSFPLGARVYPEGVNFSVFSKGATAIELLLFREMESPLPERVIALDPRKNRTYHYWHVFVPGLQAGQIYGYRVAGPVAPEKGARFDSAKVLLDPWKGKVDGEFLEGLKNAYGRSILKLAKDEGP